MINGKNTNKTALGYDQSLMNGEYKEVQFVEDTPDANVYTALDPLEEPYLITEIFSKSVSTRGPNNTVIPTPQRDTAWANKLKEKTEMVEVFSRLRHPSLEYVVQKFSQNETLYVATQFDNTRTVDRQMADNAYFYQPSEIETVADTLIDLLNYLHAFGVYGVEILPETLLLSDQNASAKVLLRRYIDGTVDLTLGDETSGEDDCRALAATLYQLITRNTHSYPYVPLSGSDTNYSEPLLQGIDRNLSNEKNVGFVSGTEWKSFAQSQSVKTALNDNVAKQVRVLTQRPVFTGSLAAIMSLGVLGYIFQDRLISIWFEQTAKPELQSSVIDKKTVEVTGISEDMLELFRPLDDLAIGGDEVQSTGNTSGNGVTLTLPLEAVVTKNSSGNGQLVLKTTSDAIAFKKANPWFEDGVLLKAVNGRRVSGVVNLHALVLAELDRPDAQSIITLTVHDAVLPLERDVALVPEAKITEKFGPIMLEQIAMFPDWILVVSKIDAGFSSSLRVGDVLVNAGTSQNTLARITDFSQRLLQLEREGKTEIGLSITRQTDRFAFVTLPIHLLLSK
jgi:hypothetical protein